MDFDEIFDSLAQKGITFPDDGDEILKEILGNEGVNSVEEDLSDPVRYINQKFPDDKSINNIYNEINRLQKQLSNYDQEIENRINQVCSNDGACTKRYEESLESLNELINKIALVSTKTKSSENIVMGVTRDIQRLENAKKNLSFSISTLNNFQILTNGINELKTMLGQGNYLGILNILPGLMMIESAFTDLVEIKQITNVVDGLHSLKDSIREKIVAEYLYCCNMVFEDMETVDPQLMSVLASLAEKCYSPLHLEFVNRFINFALNEYRAEYIDNPENSWLDKIDRRFSWFRRFLLCYDEVYNLWFPYSWEVDNQFIKIFCETTSQNLKQLLEQRNSEIDNKFFLSVIQKVIAFEEVLQKHVIDSGADETNAYYKFVKEKPISQIFDRYCYIYTDVQEKNLSVIINRYVAAYKSSGSILTLLNTTTKNADQASDESKVAKMIDKDQPSSSSLLLPCAGEIFIYYKNCLMQVSRLKNQIFLSSLAGIFKKYLNEFYYNILEAALPKVSKSVSVFSQDHLKTACCVIVTTSYWQTTIEQLEIKINALLPSPDLNSVSFSDIRDSYTSLINNGIGFLTHYIEVGCENSFVAMSKINWAGYESVGDQSQYITTLTNFLFQNIISIRDYLGSAESIFWSFCIKVINKLVTKYICQIHKIKPIKPTGVEQILLDSQILKKFLLNLPSSGTETQRQNSVYSDFVKNELKRLEIHLKLVITPHKPYSDFVEKYMNLTENHDLVSFQRILDMKSLVKAEQNILIENYKLLSNTKPTH